MSEHQTKDVETLRSKRHANPDFMGALACAVRNYAINPDRSEHQRQQSKGPGKGPGNAFVYARNLHAGLERVHVKDWQIGVQLMNGFFQRGREGLWVAGHAHVNNGAMRVLLK